MEHVLKNNLWMLNLMVIAICAWLLAGPITTFLAQILATDQFSTLAPIENTGPKTLAEIPNGKNEILDRNLFGLELSKGKDVVPLAPSTDGQIAAKTDLKLELVGTLVHPDPSKSIATVAEKGNDRKRFHVGEKILKQHEVQKILRGRVEFYNQSKHRLEYLAFNKAERPPLSPRAQRRQKGLTLQQEPPPSEEEGISQISDNEYIISQVELDRAFSNMNQILMQARAVPHVVDGKTEGFRVFAVQPNSIYQKLGIRNGDILTGVNGSSVDSVSKALTLFETLKTEKKFNIDLNRRGKTETFKYEVK